MEMFCKDWFILKNITGLGDMKILTFPVSTCCEAGTDEASPSVTVTGKRVDVVDECVEDVIVVVTE
jgi:hypothetical protein